MFELTLFFIIKYVMPRALIISIVGLVMVIEFSNGRLTIPVLGLVGCAFNLYAMICDHVLVSKYIFALYIFNCFLAIAVFHCCYIKTSFVLVLQFIFIICTVHSKAEIDRQNVQEPVNPSRIV